jgi:hypothetical protein
MFHADVSVPPREPGFNFLAYCRFNRFEGHALMFLLEFTCQTLSAFSAQSRHVDEGFLDEFPA